MLAYGRKIAEALEGVISAEWPTEFDPVKTQYAKEFKDAWIAKFGAWEGPEILFVSQLCCLMAGLEKAGSLDTDKVAAAIGSGLEFDSPCGASKMFSRPDLGNDRTVDSAVDTIVSKMVGGKIVEAGTVSADDSIKFCQRVYGK